MTIPGIDYFTTLTIETEIVDIKRFSAPWKLVEYADLTLSETVVMLTEMVVVISQDKVQNDSDIP